MFSWNEVRDFFLTEVTDWGRDCAVAGMFLTRLPFPLVKNGAQKGPLAKSMRAFPLIGVLVGLIAGLVLMIMAAFGLGPLGSAFVGLASGVLVTGALHEDGLADVADGFGGGNTVEKKLKIMRDSRIGAYGVLAVVFSVGIRAAALGGIAAPELAAAIMVAAAALSRGLLPATMYMLKPARKSGLAQRAGSPDQEGWFKALLLGILIGFLFLGPLGGLLALIAGASAASFVAWFCHQQIGGYTGDTLGAGQQSAEVSILIAVAAAL
jgi:adenosylcobinamide-GDP ribazoletransferase